MPQGVIHRRRLLHVPPGYWIIVDDFRGSGHHTFDFNYHFAPGVEVSSLKQDDDELVARAEQAGLLLGLYASRPVTKDLVRGQTAPIAGWASSRIRREATQLDIACQPGWAAAGRGITLLAPFQTAVKNASLHPVARQLQLESGSGIACAYQHHGFEDIVVFSTGSNRDSRGGLFACRASSSGCGPKMAS